MGKKRICFVAQFPPPVHGLSVAVNTLYGSGLAEKYELEKINITDNRRLPGNLAAIRRSRADLFYFTISQSRGGNLRDLAILRAIGKRPCLIHLHGGYYRTLVDQLPAWQREANFRAVGRLAGAIVLGPGLRWIFEGMLPGERIFTVPNCVRDADLIPDEDFEKKLASMGENRIRHVLFLSNMYRSKGYPEVLEMARLEKERAEQGGERKLSFDFAGAFPDRAEEAFFHQYVREKGLEDYVSFHGPVTGDGKRELLRECDFFCLLTTYPKEGQPISILEAMGNGCAIVTTNYAGIPEMVEDSVNGIVADPGHIDVKEIYERMLGMRELREVAQRNRQKVRDGFSEKRYLTAMEEVLGRVLG